MTGTRGEVGGNNGGGEGGRVFRNIYKGHMDKTKGGGIRSGRWGCLGWWGVVVGMETTRLEQQ